MRMRTERSFSSFCFARKIQILLWRGMAQMGERRETGSRRFESYCLSICFS